MSISANFPTSRPSLLLDFVNSGQLDPRVTFSRTSGATWFNSAGVLVGVDFSSTSLTVGTGWQTLTLDATAGVNRDWIVGTSVQLSASTATNTMTGVVVSYTASTQVLVVSVASVVGSGTYSTWRVSNLMPRFDYDPATLAARGFLIEEARTNSIRNNTMVGAVAGTPGTLPTNWSVAGTGPGTLTQQIVGTGTSNGITYIDVKYSGTTSTTDFNIAFEPATQIAALSGQTWSESTYLAIVGGSITNITSLRLLTEGRNAGGSTVESLLSANVQGSLTSTLQRFLLTSTLANATTAFARPAVRFDFSSGVAIDITLRIGLPQLELGAFTTSVIPTTTTSLTRSADVASVNTLSPWYNVVEGTWYAEWNTPVSSVSRYLFSTQNVLSSGNRFDININASNIVNPRTLVGGSVVATLGGGSYTAATTAKVGFSYKTADYKSSLNGATAVLVTSAGALPSPDIVHLGSLNSSLNILNGHLRRFTFYPRALSAAELQAITA